MNRNRKIIVNLFVVAVVVLAGCNAFGGEDDSTDGSTIAPAPVPTDRPTPTPRPTPQAGTIFIENNRSEPYTVSLTTPHRTVTAVDISYRNGTVVRKRLSSFDFFLLLRTSNVTGIAPVDEPRSTEQYVIAPGSRLVVPLPNRAEDFTVIYEVKQNGSTTLFIAGVVSCERDDQITIRLQTSHTVQRGSGCSSSITATPATTHTTPKVQSKIDSR